MSRTPSLAWCELRSACGAAPRAPVLRPRIAPYSRTEGSTRLPAPPWPQRPAPLSVRRPPEGRRSGSCMDMQVDVDVLYLYVQERTGRFREAEPADRRSRGPDPLRAAGPGGPAAG